jgi:transposase
MDRSKDTRGRPRALTREQVDTMKTEHRDQRVPLKELAARYGVSYSTAWKAIRGGYKPLGE